MIRQGETADREFSHVMDSVQARDGRWQHTCRKCGTVRMSRRPNYVGYCELWYKGLGSRLHFALKKAGITPERWSRFTGRPCKCRERQEMLDRLMPWL